MSEPILQFEQTHRLLSIEQLRGDRGPRSLTCNSPANIALGHACFSAQLGDQIMIEACLSNWPHAVEKQEVHHFTGFRVAELGLRRTNLLPCVDGLSHHSVHWLAKGCSCLIHWDVQKAHRRSIALLPAPAPDPQSPDLTP